MYKSHFQSEGFFRPRIAENVTISGKLKEHKVDIYFEFMQMNNLERMLIEEPEAHIHAQRQLKMMQSLQGGKKNQQIIMTTHSLMLTSVVELKNLVLLQEHKAYPMGKEYTLLDDNDYKYLERYLDATKANPKWMLIV